MAVSMSCAVMMRVSFAAAGEIGVGRQTIDQGHYFRTTLFFRLCVAVGVCLLVNVWNYSSSDHTLLHCKLVRLLLILATGVVVGSMNATSIRFGLPFERPWLQSEIWREQRSRVGGGIISRIRAPCNFTLGSVLMTVRPTECKHYVCEEEYRGE